MLTLENVLKATNGLSDFKENIVFSGISTDTRSISKGELFVAIKGEQFDGHNYLQQAIDMGAAGVLVSEEVELPKNIVIVRVDDTLKAYQGIAHFYRMSFPALKVVAITGSNGKTSTKDMVAACLASKYKIIKTQGNFNNEIGLPMTLFNLKADTEIAVVEMGMRGIGQIADLTKIACQDVAVISNVGETHIGELGSLENIAKAKSEILEYLPTNGKAVLNGDLELVRKMANKSAAPIAWFGLESADDYIAKDIEVSALGSTFTCLEKETGATAVFHIQQIGIHNVMNALSAIAVGRYFGVQLSDMVKALSSYEITGSRQEIKRFGDYIVINDAYNASPASMEAAFNTVKEMKKAQAGKSRALAVLADMLELGDGSANAHFRMGELAVAAGIDHILVYGNEAKEIAKGAISKGGQAEHFPSREEAAKRLEEILKAEDIVLLKGSHSMQVDGVIKLVFSK